MFFTSIKEINSLRKEVNSLICKGINRLRKEINRLFGEGINRLRNEINGLLSKRMSNIYNFIEFYNFLLQFKDQSSASKPGVAFLYFNSERNYDALKSKSTCILLNKNINFNKNEIESKMKNPTHGFRETNLALQLIQESQIKSKTIVS